MPTAPRHPEEHEPNCAQCGESYDPDDRVFSKALEDYICPRCNRRNTMTLSPEQARKARAAAFASTLGVDGDALFRAAMAVWSNLNPQTTSFDRALSVAGSALRAAAGPLDTEANPG